MALYNTTIYAYSSDEVYCDYTLGMSKNGNTTTVWVDGKLHGSTGSRDNTNKLYAHLHYNATPDNSSGYATTYVDTYGTSFGKGVLIFEKLNGIDIPPTGVTFYASWTIPNDETMTYKNCALFLSKSPDKVETNSNEAYLFIGKKFNNGHTTNKLRYYTEDLAPYTKCSAPTSVTASADFVKPGDKITISWSGAEAGLNNDIWYYRVYYKRADERDYKDYKDSENSTSTSVDIIIPDAPDARGSKYYFKVKTICTNFWYNSDLSEAEATCQINRLPPAPTVAPENIMIPSGGGSIIFYLSATDPDGQTTSFYYSTVPDGEKTEISNGGTIEIKDATTYYFYSFDGLEYSESYTSPSITVNTKPTIISITTTGIGTLYTSELLTNDRYKDSFYTQVKGALELSKNAKDITWYARYATIPESGSVSDWETTINLGNNNNLNANLDLSSNTEFKKLDNIVYQIGASYNDGIEDSDISWGDTNFVIAPVPTIGDFINQYGTTNVKYSTSNHFYHKASIIATKDSSVTSIDATINNDAQVITSGIRGYLNDGYFKINIENTNKNTKYTLEFTINRVIGSVTKEFEIYSAGLPYKSDGTVFSELDIFSQTASLKAYSDTGDFAISLYNFFETTDYAHAKKNYNGDPTPSTSNCLSFTLVKGLKSLDINPTYDSDSSSNSSLYFTYNKNFYKTELSNGNNPLELDLEAINSVDLKITFTDVFGQSYSITKQNYLKLDFREPFINEDGFSISVLRNNNEVIDNIREGDKVKFILNWESYNSQVATIESYIYRSSTIIDNPSNITSWERYQNNSNYIWNINTSEVIPTGLIRSGTSNKIYTVGQLNKSNYIYFKISTTINGQSRDYYTDGYRITQRQVSVSKAGFSSFNYDSDNQKISYVHTPYDSGGGNTPNNMNNTSGGIEKLEIGIQYSTDFNSESSEKKYISSTGGGSDNFVALITRSSPETIFDEESSIIEYTHSFNIGNFSYYNIRLVFQTTIGSTVKIGYGEETTIYNITPTIAYRKNQLGINTIPENFEGNDGFNPGESIKDTSILIIQSATNRNNIYFITPNNRIKFNINDGKIDGILLDAGNWN